MKSINSSSGCLKILSDLSNLTYSLVSKQYSKDEVLELRVSTSFSMCSDENLFGSIFCFPSNSINSSSDCSKIYYMDKAWLGIFSQSYLQNMDAQRREQELNF